MKYNKLSLAALVSTLGAVIEHLIFNYAPFSFISMLSKFGIGEIVGWLYPVFLVGCLIFGCLALRQIRSTGEKGRNLAKLALVTAVVLFLLQMVLTSLETS